MTRNDDYSGDGAVAMVLALGHTLYLLRIETATVLPPSHQTPHPIAAPPGRLVQDAQISTMRGVTESWRALLGAWMMLRHRAVKAKLTVPTIKKMENKSGTP